MLLLLRSWSVLSKRRRQFGLCFGRLHGGSRPKRLPRAPAASAAKAKSPRAATRPSAAGNKSPPLLCASRGSRRALETAAAEAAAAARAAPSEAQPQPEASPEAVAEETTAAKFAVEAAPRGTWGPGNSDSRLWRSQRCHSAATLTPASAASRRSDGPTNGRNGSAHAAGRFWPPSLLTPLALIPPLQLLELTGSPSLGSLGGGGAWPTKRMSLNENARAAAALSAPPPPSTLGRLRAAPGTVGAAAK